MSAQAISMARPSPMIEATFSVPARRPRSCSPPSIRLGSTTPFLRYMAPTPLGAWSLWPERESMSICWAATSMGTLPTAWTASVWNQTPRSRQIAPISGIGWMVPISLLAYMIETMAVSGRMASATCWGEISPSGPTGR